MTLMDSHTLSAIAVVAAAAAGFFLAHFWNRGRPTADEKRVAELEAQLTAARESGMRASVQAAELEREASTLRSQLLETAQRSAVYEERARLLGDAKQALENAFKSLSADSSRSRRATWRSARSRSTRSSLPCGRPSRRSTRRSTSSRRRASRPTAKSASSSRRSRRPTTSCARR